MSASLAQQSWASCANVFLVLT